MADYGAFVEIAPGRRGSDPRVGNELEPAPAFGSGVHEGRRRSRGRYPDTRSRRTQNVAGVSNSLLLIPGPTSKRNIPVGSRHIAKVRNFTNFGVFVEIEEGIDGLIHISDLSWTKKVKHPSEFTQRSVPISKWWFWRSTRRTRRLSLGHKQLEENPWNEFEQLYAVDSVHEGTVKELTDKGAVITLADNIEGFAPAKQLVKEDGTTAKVGDAALDCLFSKATKRITLSHTRVFEETKRAEENAARAEKKAAAEATKSSVKKINASVEKTTLGDITSLAELKAQMVEAAEKQEAQKAEAAAEEAKAE